jgi:hypothetical protein
MSIWTAPAGEEFEALAKNEYRNIVSTFSTCSSASDGVCYRSKYFSHVQNFVVFIFAQGMKRTKYTKISTI